jgi:hypothetical protein
MKVDGTADDTLITDLISEAADLIEQYLAIAIVKTEVTVEASARTTLDPPVLPVNSITSVKDRDGNDVEYEWNGFTIIFQPSTFTPTAPEAPLYDTTITIYDAGYTETPPGLVQAMKEVITYLYENRGEQTGGIVMMLSQNTNLLPYRQKMWW